MTYKEIINCGTLDLFKNKIIRQSRQRQALAKKTHQRKRKRDEKTHTVTSKKRPCVDSLENDDDDFE